MDRTLRKRIEKIVSEYEERTEGLRKALTTHCQELLELCPPERTEDVRLFGVPDSTWEVEPPLNISDVVTEDSSTFPVLPQPAKGICAARRDKTNAQWLCFVADLSYGWLMAVVLYRAHNNGFSRSDRKNLFEKINECPTLFEMVRGYHQAETDSGSSSSDHRPRTEATLLRKKLPILLQVLREDQDNRRRLKAYAEAASEESIDQLLQQDNAEIESTASKDIEEDKSGIGSGASEDAEDLMETDLNPEQAENPAIQEDKTEIGSGASEDAEDLMETDLNPEQAENPAIQEDKTDTLSGASEDNEEDKTDIGSGASEDDED